MLTPCTPRGNSILFYRKSYTLCSHPTHLESPEQRTCNSGTTRATLPSSVGKSARVAAESADNRPPDRFFYKLAIVKSAPNVLLYICMSTRVAFESTHNRPSRGYSHKSAL